MDKKIANNVILGVFVLVGFALFIFLIFNMGSGQGIFSSQFTLYGKFRDVKGLHSGSEISLSGLRIGTVKNISVSNDNEKLLVVEMSVSTNVKDKIRNDSVAKIVTQGVLGDKYIEFSIGTPSFPAIEANSFVQTSEVEDLFTKGGDLVEGISKHFNKGSEFEALIKNLNTASHNLALMTAEMRQSKGLLHEVMNGKSGEKLNKSMSHLENILRKVDNGEGSVGALINDPTVYEDLKSIMGGAKRSSILQYFMRNFREEGAKPQPPPKK